MRTRKQMRDWQPLDLISRQTKRKQRNLLQDSISRETKKTLRKQKKKQKKQNTQNQKFKKLMKKTKKTKKKQNSEQLVLSQP